MSNATIVWESEEIGGRVRVVHVPARGHDEALVVEVSTSVDAMGVPRWQPADDAGERSQLALTALSRALGEQSNA